MYSYTGLLSSRASLLNSFTPFPEGYCPSTKGTQFHPPLSLGEGAVSPPLYTPFLLTFLGGDINILRSRPAVNRDFTRIDTNCALSFIMYFCLIILTL